MTAREALATITRGLQSDWDRFYMAVHEPRYLRLAEAVARVAPAGPRRVLDVGPAMQTEMLRLLYPSATIDTLGWPWELGKPRDHERHVDYDLDHAAVPGTEPHLGEGYDIVVLAEVLEHSNVRPVTLFDVLGGYLNSGGHLIVGTPNAAYLLKRIRSALGRNPYGPMHDMTGRDGDVRDFHGHFREYLLEEVIAVGSSAGLEPIVTEYHNDYAYQHWKGRLISRALPILPDRFHMQLLVIFRRP